MGNWKRANIVGTCDENEIPALHERVKVDLSTGAGMDHFGPLSAGGGICGLPMWALASFNVIGNLAERGYSAELVAEHLETLASVAPSLSCKVHVGDDNESSVCVATVTLAEGTAIVGDPEIETLGEITKAQMGGHLLDALTRR